MFVTFKIQIRPVGDKERVNEVLSTLDRWRRTSRAMANQVILHRLLQAHVADMIYLNEGTKVKLDQKDHKDLLVLLVKKVQPEKRVIKVIRDLLDQLDLPGLLVLMVSQYLLKEVLML